MVYPSRIQKWNGKGYGYLFFSGRRKKINNFIILAHDIAIVTFESQFEHKSGFTAALSAVFPYEPYSEEFKSRLVGRDLEAVGMGRKNHSGRTRGLPH